MTTAPDFSIAGKPIAIGVGLNAGLMFIGNVGSGDKRQFTVLGDVVNAAARHESSCKDLNAPVVAGQPFFDALETVHQRCFEVRLNHPVRGMEPRNLYAISWAAAGRIAGRK